MSSDFAADYAAFTTAAGVVRLAGWSTVRVAGADRRTLLNNLCTNDVKSLSSGAGCEAFFCDVKGKIVAHAFMLVGDDDVLLVGVPAMAARLVPHLDRYIIREDVQLVDETASRSWLLVIGPQSTAFLSANGDSPWRRAGTTIGDEIVCAIQCPLPWPGGVLLGAASERQDRVLAVLAASAVRECNSAAFEAIRIESAWPLWGVDFDDANLPQEVDRDAAAISFRKGCYLGQETVARIDALGHVNKKLALVRFTGAPQAAVGGELAGGASVVDAAGQAVGTLTSVTWSPRHNAPLALAMLRRGGNDVGASVACAGFAGEALSKKQSASKTLRL